VFKALKYRSIYQNYELEMNIKKETKTIAKC